MEEMLGRVNNIFCAIVGRLNEWAEQLTNKRENAGLRYRDKRHDSSRICNSLLEQKLVGAVGIEPTTFGLKGRCSTTELRP
jgi:hypothetical protein